MSSNEKLILLRRVILAAARCDESKYMSVVFPHGEKLEAERLTRRWLHSQGLTAKVGLGATDNKFCRALYFKVPSFEQWRRL